jgi:anti-sigma factor RsiW
MKCDYSENDLALYAEGDLADAKIRELDSHLVSCGRCREVVEDLRETQAIFKGLKRDTVSGDALARVRIALLEQVESAKPSWGRWVYALAGAAFAVAVVAGLVSLHPWEKHQVQQAIKNDPLPPSLVRPAYKEDAERSDTVSRPVDVRASISAATRAGRLRSVKNIREEIDSVEAPAQSPQPPKSMMVKLFTDDPNVVIYWVIDQNGGSL